MYPIQLKNDPTSWLLEPSTPGVRYRALCDLQGLPEDHVEVVAARQEAYKNGPIGKILDSISEEGYWFKPGPGYGGKYKTTVWSIIYLAQLGASVRDDERIVRGCSYLLDHALTSLGQFSASGAPSGTIDCLQGNLCWALAALGCQDKRLEQAFDWMTRSITGEGVAPKSEKQSVRRNNEKDNSTARNVNTQAAYQYYSLQCGPNFACGITGGLPCAWGAVKELMAFSLVPEPQRTPAMRQAIQMGVNYLLSVDPAVSDYPLAKGERQSPHWFQLSFPIFYVADFLQTLEALVGLGYGSDPRLAHAIDTLLEKQNEHGRWLLEYGYPSRTWASCGAIGKENKWVTLRVMRLFTKLQF